MLQLIFTLGFPGGSEVKASACNEEDPGFILGLGKSPGEGNGNPLQYSCLGNPMDEGAWWPTVHRIAKSWIRLSDFITLLRFLLHLQNTMYLQNRNRLTDLEKELMVTRRDRLGVWN